MAGQPKRRARRAAQAAAAAASGDAPLALIPTPPPTQLAPPVSRTPVQAPPLQQRDSHGRITAQLGLPPWLTGKHRPTHCTPELLARLSEAILLEVSQGVPVGHVLKQVGVPQQTAWDWLAKGRAALARWDEQGEAGTYTEDEALYAQFTDLVDQARVKFEVDNVKGIAAAGRNDWRARSWLLTHSAYTRDRWKQTATVEAKVSGRMTVDVDAHIDTMVRETTDAQVPRLTAFLQMIAEPDGTYTSAEVLPPADG